MEKYLRPTMTIDSGDEEIKKTAGETTRNFQTDQEKAVSLFYFVRDSIKYSVYMTSVFLEDFKASRILFWGKGYCVQKAVLLAALGRAAGIPTRLGFATIRNHRAPPHVMEMVGGNTFYRHGYNQFFLDGRWVTATATFDKNLCRNNGLPTVEFDGKTDAFFPGQDLHGNPFIEYLEKFTPQDDLPFEWVVEYLSKKWGKEKRPWLERKK